MANGAQPCSVQPLGSARLANAMMGAQRRVIEAQRLDRLWTLREPPEAKVRARKEERLDWSHREGGHEYFKWRFLGGQSCLLGRSA